MFIDTEEAAKRCQNTLDRANRAIRQSEKREAELTRALGCSRQQWVNQVKQQFGEAGVQEQFMARKLLDETLYKKEQIDLSPVKKPFFVMNPV
ncbi:hypothetical protein [Microbulbifer sp. JMSA003]|uniref:hypothetical protein n=1 Tax=unclassified Microbulbifer TaxID=2619833 RepID=UPI0040395D0A